MSGNVYCEKILCKGSNSLLCQKVRMIQRMFEGVCGIVPRTENPKKKRGTGLDYPKEGTRP